MQGPFVLVMSELTSHIQDEIQRCGLFVDDMVLINETKEGVNKLVVWRKALELKKDLRLVGTKRST